MTPHESVKEAVHTVMFYAGVHEPSKRRSLEEARPDRPSLDASKQEESCLCKESSPLGVPLLSLQYCATF